MKQMSNENADTTLIVLLIICWFRGVTFLKTFKRFRNLVAMIGRVFLDMINFLVLLLYTSVAFVMLNENIDDSKPNIESIFLLNFGEMENNVRTTSQ